MTGVEGQLELAGEASQLEAYAQSVAAPPSPFVARLSAHLDRVEDRRYEEKCRSITLNRDTDYPRFSTEYYRRRWVWESNGRAGEAAFALTALWAARHNKGVVIGDHPPATFREPTTK